MFYYKPAKNGWKWAFVTSNGQMSASHESHPTRSNAKRAAKKFLIAAMKSQGMEFNADSFIMLEWSERPGAKKKSRVYGHYSIQISDKCKISN